MRIKWEGWRTSPTLTRRELGHRVTQFSPVTNEGREAETEQAETIARVLHSNTENSCQATFRGAIAESRTERCKGLERFRESTPEVRIWRWAGEAVRGMTVVQPHTLEGVVWHALGAVSRDHRSEPLCSAGRGHDACEACFYCTILGPRSWPRAL